MASATEPNRFRYHWYLVGLLWFCGFFNYADRQAINAVLPLISSEFNLDDFDTGKLGTAFMLVYALTGVLAGFVVDQFSRKTLISAGLAFWSIVCVLTGTSATYGQLLFYRAVEGLGESFYFPASMTIVADYHPPATRSRAMSIHQTSVYVGTIGGGIVASMLGERHGWRSPFLVLGLLGTVYAGWLYFQIIEPIRGKSESKPLVEDEIAPPRGSLPANVREIVSTPLAVMLLLVFCGANFVAAAFMFWTPSLVYQRFGISLTGSSVTAAAWSFSSLVGALCGGWLADQSAKRIRGGRALVQGVALLVAAPFVVASGQSSTVGLTALALAAVGFCKGLYDANIFASLYDVIRPPLRGTAAGLMNTVGWAGGSLAPVAVGFASKRFGIGPAIASTAVFYVFVGLLAMTASRFGPSVQDHATS